MILATCGDLQQVFANQDPIAFAEEVQRSPETLKSINEVTVTGDSAKVTATVDVAPPLMSP